MSRDTICARCAAAPAPPEGSRRVCSFGQDDVFRPDGLSCETFEALHLLSDHGDRHSEFWSDGQSVQVFSRKGKFLIVGRYHSRPYRTESCVIIDEDRVDVMPTWQDVDTFIGGGK